MSELCEDCGKPTLKAKYDKYTVDPSQRRGRPRKYPSKETMVAFLSRADWDDFALDRMSVEDLQESYDEQREADEEYAAVEKHGKEPKKVDDRYSGNVMEKSFGLEVERKIKKMSSFAENPAIGDLIDDALASFQEHPQNIEGLRGWVEDLVKTGGDRTHRMAKKILDTFPKKEFYDKTRVTPEEMESQNKMVREILSEGKFGTGDQPEKKNVDYGKPPEVLRMEREEKTDYKQRAIDRTKKDVIDKLLDGLETIFTKHQKRFEEAMGRDMTEKEGVELVKRIIEFAKQLPSDEPRGKPATKSDSGLSKEQIKKYYHG